MRFNIKIFIGLFLLLAGIITVSFFIPRETLVKWGIWPKFASREIEQQPKTSKTETPASSISEMPTPSPTATPETISPAPMTSSLKEASPIRDLSLNGVKFWAYQLQNLNEGDSLEKLASSHYDMAVIDDVRTVKDASSYDMAGAVKRLKNSSNSQGSKKLVIAYVDIGEAEDYRWYWQKDWRVGNPLWIAAPDPDGWEGNFPVNYTVLEWKNIIIYNQDSYLNQILMDGFDGIYMDWIEAYEFNKVYEQIGSPEKAREEMIRFIGEIADYARAKKPGFLVIAQNATELGSDSEYLKILDGIAQESIWYDGEASETGEQGDIVGDSELTQEYISNLKNFQKADIPVFSVDYASEKENVDRAYNLAKENGYIPYVSVRQLDKLTDTPPPNY